jgi:hypothetical protein
MVPFKAALQIQIRDLDAGSGMGKHPDPGQASWIILYFRELRNSFLGLKN